MLSAASMAKKIPVVTVSEMGTAYSSLLMINVGLHQPLLLSKRDLLYRDSIH